MKKIFCLIITALLLFSVSMAADVSVTAIGGSGQAGTKVDLRLFIENDGINPLALDVTYDKTFCTATYEWVNWRSDLTYITKKDARDFFSVFQKPYQGKVQNYQKSYYLSGGMATHLNLKKGKYKITVYTPVENQNMFTYSTETKPFEWQSNTFEYDTENPTNVIYVYPTFTQNGFYAGGWKIDYRFNPRLN